MENKRLMIIVLTVIMLLLIPIIAMNFTDEVNWTVSDFVVAGTLLLGTGLLCELAMRKIKNSSIPNYRMRNSCDHPIPYLGRICSRYFRHSLRRRLKRTL